MRRTTTSRTVSAESGRTGTMRRVNPTDLARRAARTRWFAALGRATSRLDRRLQRATDGRWTVLGRAHLPQLVLTTTGRRSGEPREVVLLHAVDGGSWVVLASNWGQAHHPAWALNLLAAPHAQVTVRGATTPVVARVAGPDEVDRLLPRMRAIWPGYEAYAQRAGRELYLFVLDPVSDGTAAPAGPGAADSADGSDETDETDDQPGG